MITKNGKYLFAVMNNEYTQLLECMDGDWRNNNKTEWFKYPLVIVGSSDTAPTTSDVNLASRILSLTKTTSVAINPSNYSSFMYSVQTTYKNNTNENITVKEVGIATSFINLDDSSNAGILIVREVLDAPVVIKPQKSYTFSITI